MPKKETSPKTDSSAPGKWLAGLDLSLTGTGVVLFTGTPGTMDSKVEAMTIKSKPSGDRPVDEITRLRGIVLDIQKFLPPFVPTVNQGLVAMEGLSFASNMMGHSGLVALNYFVRELLWSLGVPFIVVAPTSLKKFATGKGNAEKDQVMMHVLERWGYHAANNNEADAYVLATIADHLAHPQKDSDLTKPQLEVINLLKKQL